MLVCSGLLCVYASPAEQGDLTQGEQQNKQWERWFANFMAEDEHAEQSADTAAEQSGKKQRGFGDAVSIYDRHELIPSEQKKGKRTHNSEPYQQKPNGISHDSAETPDNPRSSCGGR